MPEQTIFLCHSYYFFFFTNFYDDETLIFDIDASFSPAPSLLDDKCGEKRRKTMSSRLIESKR